MHPSQHRLIIEITVRTNIENILLEWIKVGHISEALSGETLMQTAKN